MADVDFKEAKSIYDFSARNLNGDVISLEKYRGHVAIIVNVASNCGFTDNNYKELNTLYEKFSESKGLKILAFPCNQFLAQEPGTSEDICNFISRKDVRFDVFERIDVNGQNAHPLWKYLKHKQGGTFGDFIKWNFTKFVVDKEGQPVARFGPSTNPTQLLPTLEQHW